MKQFDLALAVFGEILDNDVPFNDALKAHFKDNLDDRPFRKDVAGLLGCALRHEILFRFLLNEKGLEEKEIRAAMLLLANLYYYKHLSAEALEEAVRAVLGEKFSILEPLIALKDNPEAFIPESVKRGSKEYLSLRYNTPLWVLKIWEHFGYGATYKLLRKNIRPRTMTLRVRESAIDPATVLANSDFLGTSIRNIVAYKGKEPVRKLAMVKDGSLFEEKAAIKSILDQYRVSEPSELFLYSDVKDDQVIKEVVESYGASIGLNIGVASLDGLHADASRLIRAKGLKNVNFFASKPDGFEASLSRPQDLVLLFPDSTNFDAIRECPDFFVHLKQDSLDGLIARQKDLLENASKFVALDGRLVYCVFTLDKKEGHNQIAAFLHSHEGWKLEKEEQLFAYEGLEATCYYAVLLNEANVAKMTPSISEINAAGLSSSTSLAKGK